MGSKRPILYWVGGWGALLALGYFAGDLSITPWKRKEGELIQKITQLRQQNLVARREVQAIKEEEQAAGTARMTLRQLRRDLPSGSAIAWLPTRIKEHFALRGIADAVTRLNTTGDEPGMPGYEKSYWAVDLPMTGATSEMRHLLTAVADLEQPGSIVKVLDLAIREEELGRRTAVINIAALVEKLTSEGGR
jgi:hypothetical protein